MTDPTTHSEADLALARQHYAMPFVGINDRFVERVLGGRYDNDDAIQVALACISSTRAAEQAKHAEVVAEMIAALEPFAEAAQGFRPDDADTMRPAVVQAVHYRRAASTLQSYRSQP